MNLKKLVAIIFIWVLVTAGWMVLGTVVMVRTEGAGTREGDVARGVEGLWGTPQVQPEPSVRAAGASDREGAPPATSEVIAEIDTQFRKRGLKWFSVYHVRFTGSYTVTNDGDASAAYTVRFHQPESNAEFSEQEVTIDGERQPRWTDTVTTPSLEPGDSCVVVFSYASTGTSSWTYALPADRMINDLQVTVRIDSPDYDFDPDCSPPDVRNMQPDGDGRYDLVWNRQLVTNARNVRVLMPERKQPGALASRISFFAPVSLLFFFVVMIIIQIVRRLRLHPMHYLFLSAAFFAFHLLLAYLVDHAELHLSFWIAAATSVFLVVMYLWLVAGPKAGILYAGVSQLVYLVLFSYSFFLEGFTGLTVTIGSVVTLGVLMVLTAKVRWGETLPELEPKRGEVPAPAGEINRPAPPPPQAPEP